MAESERKAGDEPNAMIDGVIEYGGCKRKLRLFAEAAGINSEEPAHREAR